MTTARFRASSVLTDCVGSQEAERQARRREEMAMQMFGAVKEDYRQNNEEIGTLKSQMSQLMGKLGQIEDAVATNMEVKSALGSVRQQI